MHIIMQRYCGWRNFFEFVTPSPLLFSCLSTIRYTFRCVITVINSCQLLTGGIKYLYSELNVTNCKHLLQTNLFIQQLVKFFKKAKWWWLVLEKWRGNTSHFKPITFQVFWIKYCFHFVYFYESKIPLHNRFHIHKIHTNSIMECGDGYFFFF